MISIFNVVILITKRLSLVISINYHTVPDYPSATEQKIKKSVTIFMFETNAENYCVI